MPILWLIDNGFPIFCDTDNYMPKELVEIPARIKVNPEVWRKFLNLCRDRDKDPYEVLTDIMTDWVANS